MSENIFEPNDGDHPGLIYNPESPFWHKVDFDNLPDTEDGLSNELAFVASSVALWLASMGFAITWFPPDPANVCPIPAWMIADAYAELDRRRGGPGRSAEFWQGEMERQGLKAYGIGGQMDFDEFIESLNNEN